MVARTMFLRAKVRKKDGKQHRYFSVVENRRVGPHQTAQRTVLYWGEINDRQEATWRKTLQVFDENHQQYTTLSLFPEDREIPAAASHRSKSNPARWSCVGRASSATAGWAVSCGDSCSWRSSGKKS